MKLKEIKILKVRADSSIFFFLRLGWKDLTGGCSLKAWEAWPTLASFPILPRPFAPEALVGRFSQFCTLALVS